MIYSTTMLPATNDAGEISRCFLDLLKKLNDVSSSIPTISANGPSIYASGSNSNGSYIQFADGTMEEWKQESPINVNQGPNGNFYYQGGAITYPIPFIVIPVLQLTMQRIQQFNVSTAYATTSQSVSGCTYELACLAIQESAVMWHAIGRWK